MMEDLNKNKGIDLLEQAQHHPANNIYKLTSEILETYFDA